MKMKGLVSYLKIKHFIVVKKNLFNESKKKKSKNKHAKPPLKKAPFLGEHCMWEAAVA